AFSFLCNLLNKNKTVNDTTDISQNIWEKFFNDDNISKYVLRRVSDNKYQFLHKSCREYYAAQKIVIDIISWKPSMIGDINNINNQQFQQQFEVYAHQLIINRKLLNDEMGVIQFIADRIHDNKSIFINLKSRLLGIIECSKNNSKVSIAATILNAARVSMNNRSWDKINIPYAILDYAFLEGTSPKEAILDNVSLLRACLSYTDFTIASVNQVNFGEYCYLKGHSGNVNSVRFSPDGRKIVSGSKDKTIRLWDLSSGKQIQSLKCHTNYVCFVHFSHDGNMIASGSGDKTIQLWDASSGKQIQSLKGHSDFVISVQFLPNDSMIVSGSCDNTIRLWDVSSGKQLQSLEGHTNHVNSVQFSSNGNIIVSSSDDHTIRLYDISVDSSLVHFSVDGETSLLHPHNERKCLRKCIWQGGVQKTVLSLRGSTWKDAKGLTLLQLSVVEQYGGSF
ncbi:hypothetical protein RFI_18389, partial [Reticulomyxa filosa]